MRWFRGFWRALRDAGAVAAARDDACLWALRAEAERLRAERLEAQAAHWRQRAEGMTE